MSQNENHKMKIIFLILGCVFTSYGHCLPSDAEQQLKFRCLGTETYDPTEQISICQGGANVEQGSLKVNSDEMVVRVIDNGSVELTLTGAPVTVEHQLTLTSPVANIEAEKVVYNDESEVVTLQNNIVLDRGNGMKITSKKTIEYNLRTGATAGENTETIITPRKKILPNNLKSFNPCND